MIRSPDFSPWVLIFANLHFSLFALLFSAAKFADLGFEIFPEFLATFVYICKAISTGNHPLRLKYLVHLSPLQIYYKIFSKIL